MMEPIAKVNFRASQKPLNPLSGIVVVGAMACPRPAALLAAGVPLKVVSELLGHSSVAITVDIYAHVLPEMQQEAVKRMDDLFRRS